MWSADGLYHQYWTYTQIGISLDIVGKEDERQTVSRITVTEPCTFKTKRNIGIGSRIDELEQPTSQKLILHLQVQVHYPLHSLRRSYFSIENKKVNQIFIGVAAE